MEAFFEFIIEFLMEFLMEFLFEGLFEVLGSRRKLPMPIRILTSVLLIGLVITFFTVLLVVAFNIMEETNFVLGLLFALFDIFLLGCGLYAVKKKLKIKKTTAASDQ